MNNRNLYITKQIIGFCKIKGLFITKWIIGIYKLQNE
jgi:hypothetical protein